LLGAYEHLPMPEKSPVSCFLGRGVGLTEILKSLVGVEPVRTVS
jgi:hypothetical protein